MINNSLSTIAAQHLISTDSPMPCASRVCPTVHVSVRLCACCESRSRCFVGDFGSCFCRQSGHRGDGSPEPGRRKAAEMHQSTVASHHAQDQGIFEVCTPGGASARLPVSESSWFLSL